MRVGLIGVGVVGGTLLKWFQENTQHQIRCLDPAKGMNDSLEGCDAIFISVPVPAAGTGQDLQALREAILTAKKHSQNIFIRSTVLPGTNDLYGTIAMPEFLTERTAYEDFCRLPILLGPVDRVCVKQLFPGKEVMFKTNAEAELSKFAHNCFGAMKVTYFNIIADLCEKLKCDFESVKQGVFLTGYINKDHTMVPGPDGKYGYAGKCFPENMDAFTRYLRYQTNHHSYDFFKRASELNQVFRNKGVL